jgi:hypothetical protein
MHSPRAAHFSQLSFSSVQLPRVWCTLSNDATRIHFVADHFSPFMTGHPAWRLTESVVPSGLRLKKRRASPLRGFTGEEIAYPLRSIPKLGIPKTTLVRKSIPAMPFWAHSDKVASLASSNTFQKSTENCLKYETSNKLRMCIRDACTQEKMWTIFLSATTTKLKEKLPRPRGKLFPLLLLHQLSTKEQ